jgi:Flp pilus assembly pilin Flp
MISRHRRARERRRGRTAPSRPTGSLRAFILDERGQDVIEYGLLSALIGIVSITVWLSIEGSLQNAYLSYEDAVRDLWESPNPGGS